MAADSNQDLDGMSAKDAFNRGVLLRGQFKNKESHRYLRYASDHGNIDASYLYGIELSTFNPTIRKRALAKKYFLKAAEGNHLRAMKMLYTTPNFLSESEAQYWKKKYLGGILSLKDTQPTNALFYLYQYYLDSEPKLSKKYFEQSLSLKQSDALLIKAQNVRDGEDFYFFHQSRFEAIKKLLIQSAQQNNIAAMRELIIQLKSRGKYEYAFQWHLILIQHYDLLSVAKVGQILTDSSYSKKYGQDIDMIRGVAYLNLYLRHAGTDKMKGLYKSIQAQYDMTLLKMTSDEVRMSYLFEQKEFSKQPFFYVDGITGWDRND